MKSAKNIFFRVYNQFFLSNFRFFGGNRQVYVRKQNQKESQVKRISFKWHKQASESDYGKKTRKEECNHTYEIR